MICARQRCLLSILLLMSSLVICAGALAAPITWSTTGSLNTARTNHTATLLPSGQVLVAGGQGGAPSYVAIGSVEIYDPGAAAWSVVASLNTARQSHTATLLPSGLVLVVGGQDANGSVLNTAELYDPTTNSWSFTLNNLHSPRVGHTATLLPSGLVLVVGGQDANNVLNTAELYDPATNMWTPSTGALNTARESHIATLLPSGLVLVAGDTGSGTSGVVSSAELYDPDLDSWTTYLPGNLNTARAGPTATLLTSGQVLIAGGSNNHGVFPANTELYNPNPISLGGSWTATTNTLATARTQHTATLLPSGQVLVTGGGQGFFTVFASTEVYDPGTNSWSSSPAANLATARYGHTATLLASGQVLVVGGTGSGGTVLASAELYDSGNQWNAAGALATARWGYSATLLPSGKVLVAGGESNSGVLASTEIYDPTTSLWSPAGNLNTARYYHTATLLPSGQVLVAGGYASNGTSSGTAELYGVPRIQWTLLHRDLWAASTILTGSPVPSDIRSTWALPITAGPWSAVSTTP